MTTPYDYAQTHQQNFIEALKTLLRIPSISTEREHKNDMYRAAEWLRDHCLKVGLTRAEIFETAGHPIVYGEWLGAGDAPTVLIYGHYDVQPADDPHQEWKSDPFEPVERNGNLYARGATDDKGQTFIHLKAFESFMQTHGTFPLNFKMMIEGEEEDGSKNLDPFVKAHLDLLKADVVIISDSGILTEDQPSIVYGLRGNVYMEIEVFGPERDLHSGSYGGAVHNPAQALTEIVAQLHDQDGHVTVPGFYDEVRPLTPADREAMAEVPFPEDRLKHETGVRKAWGDPNYTIRERIGARPTLEICGIVGGWTGEGSKTVIPARALAKVSCRLVPDQDPDRVYELLKAYVTRLTPDTISSQVRMLHVGKRAAVIPINAKPFQVAASAYEHVFGKKPVFLREGGSIPVVSTYQDMLNVPVILMGFGLPDDNLHAPNEKITLSMFHRGVQTMIHFYEHLPNSLG